MPTDSIQIRAVDSAFHVRTHGMAAHTLAGVPGSPPKAMSIQSLVQSPVSAWPEISRQFPLALPNDSDVEL